MPTGGSVFVDTSAFYALLVGSEMDHAAVSAAFARVLRQGRPLLTSNYVLVETTVLLQHRIGFEPVRDFDLHVVPLLDVRWIDSEVHRKGVERLFRTDQRRVSLVDAVSFVCMEIEDVHDVLSLDSDFAAAGFRLIP
jgi:predicted nucleic acid-binding protein